MDDEDTSRTAPAQGQAARAEQGRAEWLGWMEANAYSTHPDDCEGMAEAFAAGMREPQPAPGDGDSGLVAHARRELELCGQYAEDPEYSESVIRAVAEFASYGHSGGSAMIACEQLHALLGFKTLSPLTSDPAEWEDRSAVSGSPLWQNRRDPAVFSADGGATWRSLDDEPQSAPGLAAVEAERDKLQRACQTLGKTVVWQAETLYAAWIEISRGDLPSAVQWILNGIPDVDDNPPDQQWNGTETAQEWFDRTREDPQH